MLPLPSGELSFAHHPFATCEQLSASYDLQTMSMTPTKPAIDIPLSPRSTNAVRHIHTRADPQASSPVAASASDELKTFALLEQDSSTDDLSKPAAIAADDAAGSAASPATAKSNGSNSSTPGSGIKKVRASKAKKRPCHSSLVLTLWRD